MNEINRYYPSPSIRSADPLDRYLARQALEQRIGWGVLLVCIFLFPALLGWGFGSGAGSMAAWFLYRFIIYLMGWALAALALFAMYIVATQLVRFFQNRRY